jgi:hypothetical protein
MDPSGDAEEFDRAMRRAGMPVPPELRAGAFAVHVELSRMAALLRQPRAAGSEPAHVFQLGALLPPAATGG